MIYTGYYSKVKEYQAAGLKVVSISRTSPANIHTDICLPTLAPDSKTLWDFKEGKIDDAEYEKRYIAWLEQMGIRKVLLLIHACGDDIVLCCWEAPGKFCHRHLLADYINSRTKLDIQEYTK